MQTVIKQCVMSVILVLAGPAMALTCGQCKREVLATDSFCQNCGADVIAPPLVLPTPSPQPKPELQSHEYRSNEQSWTSSSTDLPFYQGMGRGLVTVCGSPLECMRFVGISFVEVVDWDKRTSRNSSFNAGDLGPIGAALAGGLIVGTAAVGVAGGCVSAVGDVCVGTLDLLTFGVVGDAVWKGQKKSPYFWSRRWGRGDVGGAIF